MERKRKAKRSKRGQSLYPEQLPACTGKWLKNHDPARYKAIVAALRRRERVNAIADRFGVSWALIRGIKYHEGLDTQKGMMRAVHEELLGMGAEELQKRLAQMRLAELMAAMRLTMKALDRME